MNLWVIIGHYDDPSPFQADVMIVCADDVYDALDKVESLAQYRRFEVREVNKTRQLSGWTRDARPA